jgi:YHS domain-containing protein
MASKINVSSGLTAQGFCLAMHGYDLVSYFTQGQPVVGYEKYSTAYKEASYRFASESNLKAFESDPEKYLPQYGGFCSFGTAEGGKFDGNPQLWKIVDGKLYLVVNEDVQKLWGENIPHHIEIADHNWPKIADKAIEELNPELPPKKLS